MKKILSLVTVAALVTFISCGPSAEEKAAAEKARMDSINNAMMQMTADSLAKVAEMEKAVADSMAMVMRADSIAKAEMEAKKTGSKPKPKPKTVTERKKLKKLKKLQVVVATNQLFY